MTTLTNEQAAALIAGMRANHEQHALLPLLCAEALRMAEAALRGQTATADMMGDADRFAWWFGGHRESSDEIVRLWLAELADNPPSLDEWRKAIDAARADKGAT